MGIMSFIKEAGQKLFGHAETEAVAQQAQAMSSYRVGWAACCCRP